MFEDPKDRGPKPPYPSQQQGPPGLESDMDALPDYGEESYKGSGKLTGKPAVITGGDSGIGRAVALAFAREGADVLISYLSEESDAKKTARLVEAAGRKCVTMPGDVSEEAQQVGDQHVVDPGRLPEPATAALCDDQGGDPELHGRACPDARQAGHPRELRRPGPIWTPLIPATMPKEKVKEFGKNVALGRPGQPAELAPAYVLLASNDSSYMAGATVAVTGGKPLI